MTPGDAAPFTDLLRDLTTVFPFRGSVDTIGAVYFRALKRFTLAEIRSASDVWIQQGARFPKPMDLAGSVPRRQQSEILIMTDDETHEYQRAEALRWEDRP